MISITDKQRGVLFELFKCYADTVYQNHSEYYISLSRKHLSKCYLQFSAPDVLKLKPFNNLSTKLSTAIDRGFKINFTKSESKEEKQRILKENIKDNIFEIILKEVQLFNINLKGEFSLKREFFSKEDASRFIDFLIGYFMDNNILLSDKLVRMLEVQEHNKLCFLALLNKKCCICGKEITGFHHKDRVGTEGYKFDTGLGKRISPLCPIHHAEVEDVGEYIFTKRYGDRYMYMELNENQVELLKNVYKHHFRGYNNG